MSTNKPATFVPLHFGCSFSINKSNSSTLLQQRLLGRFYHRHDFVVRYLRATIIAMSRVTAGNFSISLKFRVLRCAARSNRDSSRRQKPAVCADRAWPHELPAMADPIVFSVKNFGRQERDRDDCSRENRKSLAPMRRPLPLCQKNRASVSYHPPMRRLIGPSAKTQCEVAFLFPFVGSKTRPISNSAVAFRAGAKISRTPPSISGKQTRSQRHVIFTQRITDFDRLLDQRPPNERAESTMKSALRKYRAPPDRCGSRLKIVSAIGCAQRSETAAIPTRHFARLRARE